MNDQLRFVADVARDAGRLVLSHYGRVDRLTKTHSAAQDEAVTIADRESQRLIVSALRARFPDDGIVGEESDSGTSITFDCKNPLGRNWVIDPIDGTNNFVNGLGCFCVCIGLLDKGFPMLGVVYDVTRDEVYSAARGHGAWRGERQVHAPKTPVVDGSMLMLTSNLLDPSGNIPRWAQHWVWTTGMKVRIVGSAALEAVTVASGVAHAAITVNGKLWDAIAAAAVAIEAGARFTSLSGHDIFPFDLAGYSGGKVPFLCCGPLAHAEIMQTIRHNS